VSVLLFPRDPDQRLLQIPSKHSRLTSTITKLVSTQLFHTDTLAHLALILDNQTTLPLELLSSLTVSHHTTPSNVNNSVQQRMDVKDSTFTLNATQFWNQVLNVEDKDRPCLSSALSSASNLVPTMLNLQHTPESTSKLHMPDLSASHTLTTHLPFQDTTLPNNSSEQSSLPTNPPSSVAERSTTTTLNSVRLSVTNRPVTTPRTLALMDHTILAYSSTLTWRASTVNSKTLNVLFTLSHTTSLTV